MTQQHDGRSDLIAVIHEVRKRWRMKLALRGAAMAAGCIALALIVSAMLSAPWHAITPLADSEMMHAKIQHSRLVVLDNAGHVSNLEQTEQFNDALMTFLESVAA